MQYLSELRIFAFNFAPRGWAQCNGQILQISTNQALFSLIGITYGGNGTTNFQLPDLQARVPMHIGKGFGIGLWGGEGTHFLQIPEMPGHTHSLIASTKSPDVNSPIGHVWASNTGYTPYGMPPTAVMANDAGGYTGGNVPHNNMSPYLTLNICIALTGVYPTPA